MVKYVKASQFFPYNPEMWEPEDVELHKSMDWGIGKKYTVPVPEDSFIGTATLYQYRGEPVVKDNVKFIKYFRENPIYPPYYAPEQPPFESDFHAVGPMFDGNYEGVYQIHDRYEDSKLNDILSI